MVTRVGLFLCDDVVLQYFVLIGASSAMGPFLTLLALGANIIALDIPLYVPPLSLAHIPLLHTAHHPCSQLSLRRP